MNIFNTRKGAKVGPYEKVLGGLKGLNNLVEETFFKGLTKVILCCNIINNNNYYTEILLRA